MFKFLGRLARKMIKKIKSKMAKIAAKKSRKAPALTGEPRFNAGSKVFKVLILSAIASGLIASGLAETPIGAPVTAVIGGEIARTTQQIWS